MGSGKDLSPRKISEIKTLLLHTNNSQRKIAQIAGVSKTSVYKVKASLNQNVILTPKRRGRCGRKRKTTPRSDRKIRSICVANRKKSVTSLTQMVRESGVDVSRRTVQRRLAEEGLIAHRPAKKPKLTPAMKKRRLAWAREHQHWGMDDWSKVRRAFC